MHSRRSLTRGLVKVRSRNAARPSEARGSGRPGALGSLSDTGAEWARGADAGAGRSAPSAQANLPMAGGRPRPARPARPAPSHRARASAEMVVRVFSTVFAAITWEFSSVRIFCSVPNQNRWVPLGRNPPWRTYRHVGAGRGALRPALSMGVSWMELALRLHCSWLQISGGRRGAKQGTVQSRRACARRGRRWWCRAWCENFVIAAALTQVYLLMKTLPSSTPHNTHGSTRSLYARSWSAIRLIISFLFQINQTNLITFNKHI